MFTRRKLRPRRSGFTLIEASLTTVIIGVGVVAMMQLLATGTMSNIASFEQTTGVNVSKAIREITVQKTMAQVIAMNGATHNPPWNSQAQPMNDLNGWKQTIAVQAVNKDKLTQNIVDADPSAVRVTVTVTHNGMYVCDMNWYTFKKTP
jgi:Tfp pilus assembly protein PilV